jgi:hypothetical protein
MLRERILRSAMDLFSQKGFEHVSVNDVAVQVGVVKEAYIGISPQRSNSTRPLSSGASSNFAAASKLCSKLLRLYTIV